MRLTLTAEDVPHIALPKDHMDFVATIEDVEGTDMVSVAIYRQKLCSKFECKSEAAIDKIEEAFIGLN